MFFYTGNKFPRLQGSLIVAGASTKKIAQMVIRGDFIRQGDTMLDELGVRFRDIRQGPDGNIYVLTEGRLRGPNDTDGMLLRSSHQQWPQLPIIRMALQRQHQIDRRNTRTGSKKQTDELRGLY